MLLLIATLGTTYVQYPVLGIVCIGATHVETAAVGTNGLDHSDMIATVKVLQGKWIKCTTPLVDGSIVRKLGTRKKRLSIKYFPK